MAPRTPYRRAPSHDDSGGVCDIVFLLLVPCFPIGRAVWLGGSTLAWTAVVATLVALLYGGGLACFVVFVTSSLRSLANTHGWSILLRGWVLYAIGPLFDVLLLIFWLWAVNFACDIGDCDSDDEVLQRIPWLVGSAIMLMSVVAIALFVRSSLIRRFEIPRPTNCGSSCWVVCAPLCCVARTMMAARQALAREQQTQSDELPAYTA